MNKLCLWDFYVDCGRIGSLEGLFVATKEDVAKLIGKTVDFGECLGKHSDVEVDIEEHEIKLVSEDEEKIMWLIGLMNGRTISGFNPFDYIEPEELEEEE